MYNCILHVCDVRWSLCSVFVQAMVPSLFSLLLLISLLSEVGLPPCFMILVLNSLVLKLNQYKPGKLNPNELVRYGSDKDMEW